jgi:hypothetical protein
VDGNPLAPVVLDLAHRLDAAHAREADLQRQLDARDDATLAALANVAEQCRERVDAEGVL